MNLAGRHINTIYFLGIGGIGMSALARYFNLHGVKVAGYDKTPTSLTFQLVSEGMDIHFEDRPAEIPADADLVIYTPAIPKDLAEFVRIRELGIPLFKRAEVLGMVTADKFTIAVAGTHGKTTITSMIAHMLRHANKPVTAFLGGISKNYENNLISSGQEEILVVEADEFDRSFLHLRPDIAVISSMDADHLDIYQTREGMLESFSQFALQVKPGGKVVLRSDLFTELPILPNAISYSVSSDADFSVTGLTISGGAHAYNIHTGHTDYNNIKLTIAGRHNVENSLAAAAACHLCGLTHEEITAGLNTYKGVRRRFDIRIQEKARVYIDDYAHHPRELEAFIKAIRELYPERKITGIFQPHLYSRTRDFAEGFAQSLDLLDEAILLDIYPAREEPIPGVSSEMILYMMSSQQKELVKREELLRTLDLKRPEVLLTIGAGDIDLLIKPIEELIMTWND